MKTGIEQIADERKEQIKKHGFTVEKDVKKRKDQSLLDIVTCIIREDKTWIGKDLKLYEKIKRKSYPEQLVISGALIAAEIDRLQSKDS